MQRKNRSGLADDHGAVSQPAFWILVVYFTLPASPVGSPKIGCRLFWQTRQPQAGAGRFVATGYINWRRLAEFFWRRGGELVDATDESRSHLYQCIGRVIAGAACLAWLCVEPGRPLRHDRVCIAGDFMIATTCRSSARCAPEHRATGYGFMNFVSISVGGRDVCARLDAGPWHQVFRRFRVSRR